MKYDVSVDKNLFKVYPEIRLGLLRFHAEVQEPNDQFWSYMNTEVLPQVRSAIEGKKALQGTITGDNNRFLRLWYEVSTENTAFDSLFNGVSYGSVKIRWKARTCDG